MMIFDHRVYIIRPHRLAQFLETYEQLLDEIGDQADVTCLTEGRTGPIRCPESRTTYSIPVSRHTNPLLAFSRIGSTA